MLKKPVGYWLTKSVSSKALANIKNNTEVFFLEIIMIKDIIYSLILTSLELNKHFITIITITNNISLDLYDKI